MERFVAFDIEIAAQLPDGADDWKSFRPLGISCAATLTSEGKLRLWHGPELADGRLAERMTPAECQGLVEHLVGAAQLGIPIVTWNGLGFDFDVLQEECCPGYMRDFCHLMAYHDHVDVAFQMLCEKGFMIGLQTAALSMGLAGKIEGMSGALAPQMWAQDRKAQDQVLEYVAQDVRTTAELYRAICRARELRWTAKSGRLNFWRPTFRVAGDINNPRLLTVDECLQLPEPDTSWMSNPWPRSKFAGWLKLAAQ